jgi:Ricin-type beta-trefoil lectin domain-like
MSDQPISDGTYRVRGPGGLLTDAGGFPGIAVLRDGEGDQRWKVVCESGAYTVRNTASGLYLGGDGDPNEPLMTVKGTKKAFSWKLSSGQDDDETTFVLTSAASSEGLVLSMSLLRIFPPLVAILPPRTFSTVEWAFDPVG